MEAVAILRAGLIILFALVLVACGGGGGDKATIEKFLAKQPALTGLTWSCSSDGDVHYGSQTFTGYSCSGSRGTKGTSTSCFLVVEKQVVNLGPNPCHRIGPATALRQS